MKDLNKVEYVCIGCILICLVIMALKFVGLI